MVRVLLGEVFVVWRGADRKKSAAIALFGVDFFRERVDKIRGLWYDRYEGTPYDGYFLGLIMK